VYSYHPPPVYNASGCDDMFHNIEIEHEHARGIQQLLGSGEITTKDLELVLQQFKLKRVEQILSGKVLKGKSFTSYSVQKAIADFEVEQMLKRQDHE
jgi:fructose-specific phosphotransferase system component IIB